jgi:hypothetical protein
VDRDEVALAQQVVEVEVARSELLLGFLVPGAVVVEDLHPEAPPPTGDGLSYAPHADDPEPPAPHVEAPELLRPPPLPLPGPEQPFSLAEPARRGEHEHEGDVGGGLVEDARGVRDDDAPLSGGLDVYVVVADGHVGDHPQAVARGVHDLAVHLLGGGREDAARAADGLE